MALKGHNRQGYCKITEATNDDGTISETLGTGVITTHVVNFTGSRASDSTQLWAGDSIEEEEDSNEGDVKMTLSQLTLADEAAFGGHNYDAETGMTEKDTDKRPYFRYAAIGVGVENGVTFYRLAKYHKVKFGPVDDDFATKVKNVAYKTHSVAGKCYYAADGSMRSKADFDTFDKALAAMKTFLNIKVAQA